MSPVSCVLPMSLTTSRGRKPSRGRKGAPGSLACFRVRATEKETQDPSWDARLGAAGLQVGVRAARPWDLSLQIP